MPVSLLPQRRQGVGCTNRAGVSLHSSPKCAAQSPRFPKAPFSSFFSSPLCAHRLIRRGNKTRSQTEQLVLKCASLLLPSKDDYVRVLCAKSFYRCHLYQKCIAVLDSVKPNGDARLEATIQELRHLAEQAENRSNSIESMKLDPCNPSYFHSDGGVCRLLNGALSEEELITEESLVKEKLIEGKIAAEQTATVESLIVPMRNSWFTCIRSIRIANISISRRCIWSIFAERTRRFRSTRSLISERRVSKI